jgi:hypothetical protein
MLVQLHAAPLRNRVERPFLIRLATAMLALFSVFPTLLNAQGDGGEPPLGDIARSFRKKPSAQEVIDNDNLSHVMDQVESGRVAGSSLRYSIDGSSKSFHVSTPDVTCSLSFSANAQALLSSQYAQFDLPANQLIKLDGPATIDGDSLQVSVFNGTDWHISEVAVALTLLKKAGASDTAVFFGNARLLPAVNGSPVQDSASPAQKRSDATFLYRMRAAAPPSMVTVFRAPLNVEIGPEQEWHWAIVQARGYPPEHKASLLSQPMPGPAESSAVDSLPSVAPTGTQPN